MNVSMDGWMDGCEDGWMNGWMDECEDGWMDECENGWMDVWMATLKIKLLAPSD